MNHKPYGVYEKFLKRPLDCLLAICGCILLSPVMAGTAGLVRIYLGKPVLFTQKRLGKEEKVFKLYKFRSMSEARGADGRLLSDDERLSPFGRILRSTSLDELPELFNIIKGDMSMIGPRPLLAEYQPYYTESEHHRHDVRPGLSGLAQVNGRNAISWADMFDWDLKYVNRITFLGDAKIFFRTIGKVLKRSDIQVGIQNTEGPLNVERSKKVVREGSGNE